MNRPYDAENQIDSKNRAWVKKSIYYHHKCDLRQHTKDAFIDT